MNMLVIYNAKNIKTGEYKWEEEIKVRTNVEDCEWKSKEMLEKIYPKKKGWEIELVEAYNLFN